MRKEVEEQKVVNRWKVESKVQHMDGFVIVAVVMVMAFGCNTHSKLTKKKKKKKVAVMKFVPAMVDCKSSGLTKFACLMKKVEQKKMKCLFRKMR